MVQIVSLPLTFVALLWTCRPNIGTIVTKHVLTAMFETLRCSRCCVCVVFDWNRENVWNVFRNICTRMFGLNTMYTVLNTGRQARLGVAFCNLSFLDSWLVWRAVRDQTFSSYRKHSFFVTVTKTWNNAFFQFCGQLRSLRPMNVQRSRFKASFAESLCFVSLARHSNLISATAATFSE